MRVRAHNTAAESENKIHDDRVAAAYGYRGGLVPGVTVYGYMIPAVLDSFGPAWLEQGGMKLRLLAPCYEDEWIDTTCDGAQARAEREGTLLASGSVDIATQSPLVFPAHPLPSLDERPVASIETIVAGRPLGTWTKPLDAANDAAVPERLLWMANEIIVRNFRSSPWIHTGSDVRYHRLAECGAEISVHGKIEECFERKGRQFAIAGLSMLADGVPVASVRHTFIFQLPITSSRDNA